MNSEDYRIARYHLVQIINKLRKWQRDPKMGSTDEIGRAAHAVNQLNLIEADLMMKIRYCHNQECLKGVTLPDPGGADAPPPAAT